ncbi:MAG: hypothetical protein JXR46_08895 [Calditrichaceae bacterium]|nr:hypothetical protein [Calditrichaceae bacterium]MBN2709148.1 hypothetical protein [Calditrichaceae bacterium]RQV96104.1 MAG: hypothetical protein EH224_05205 [Calditrichota bacterium]
MVDAINSAKEIYNFSEIQNPLSVFIESRNHVSDTGWKSLLELLKKLQISEIFIQGQLSNEHAIYKALRERKDRSLDQIKLIYQFNFNLQTYLNDNRSALQSSLLSLLYSTRQYHFQLKSWDEKIKKIYGWSPEILTINTDKKSVLKNLDDPASIHCILKIINSNENPGFEDVTEYLNRKTGWLRLATEKNSNFRLLIIRSAKILDDDTIHYFMNYFNKEHLQAAQKHFIKSLLPKGIQEYGVYYDLENILPFKGLPHWIFSSAEIEKELGTELSISFASMILNNYKTTWHFSKSMTDLRNRLLDELFPMLDSVSDLVFYKTDTDFPLPLCLFRQNLYFEVDENKFIRCIPYYWNTIIKLRLNNGLTEKIENRKVTVLIHDLYNTRYSFAEKKFHIDQLLLSGAHKISFRIGYPAFEGILQLADKTGIKDPNTPGYLAWFGYLRQLSFFLNQGKEICEILIINPPPEAGRDTLYKTLGQLNRAGISYLLIDIDQFEDDRICQIQDRFIRINNRDFPAALLPGIEAVPLATIKKLYDFMKKGGITAVLSHLPKTADKPDDQNALIRLKKRMWLDEAGASTTMYRMGQSGGVGYYIPHIPDFNISIPEISSILSIKIVSKAGYIIHSLRETEDRYYLFVLNLNNESTGKFEIICSFTGEIFTWNFNSETEEPYFDWDFIEQKEKTKIYLELAAQSNCLFIIKKTDASQLMHIGNYDLNGITAFHKAKGGLRISGWQREAGKFRLKAMKGDEKFIFNYEVKTKLPMLNISPKNWFLESKSFKGNIDLGDQSEINRAIFESIVYHKLIMIEKEYTTGMRLVLDLGEVKHWCQVYLNDQFAGQAIYPPWKFDITDFIREGENKLSIRIFANLSNQLADELNSIQMVYPILEYGLFGPVTIIPYSMVEINA